jgi:DNA-binding transcriptional regulator YhcF (GntR family)
MENTNYITVQGWMINELNLKGNELLLYAIIYGFSQSGQGEYFGSQRYISKALRISLPTSNKIINKLLRRGLIEKTGESHYQVSCGQNVDNSVDNKGGVLKKVKQGVKESLTLGVKESLTNKDNTNNNIYIYKDRQNKKKQHKYSFRGNPCRIDDYTGKWKCLENGEWLEVADGYEKEIIKQGIHR